ncbi:MAG: type III secretion system cytoplasmic ring protein SctQ [Alphaproteobacteria bacterium]|nr:type III secretion system cytoplasmic ring protein SctQ [Alphaproteobacteria bacterium]MDX5368327.1 type III secretion system cytoplasmic ring protein SctQ [Alphaproteobacteria bacterium]MDX5463122.1 type III secretion system cytoplasmic ring protein SctQ [Alphaproteobacteria bacterium]
MTTTSHDLVAEPFLWPAVDPDLVPLDRAFAHPHAPLAIEAAGIRFEVRWSLVADRAAREGDAVVICLEAGGDVATLACPRRLADHLLGALSPGLTSGPCPPVELALALELAFEETLDALETALGEPVRLSLSAPAARVVPMRRTVHVTVTAAGLPPATVSVRLSPRLADLFARRIRRNRTAAAWVRELRLPLSVRTGSLLSTRGEVATLMPGDILLLDEERLSRSQVVVAVAERRLFVANVQGTQLTFAGPDQTLSSPEGWTMTTHDGPPATEPVTGGETAGSLDDLPVTLIFELSRKEIAVSELSALGPGYVVDLGVPITEPVTILGGGRRIGKGELVRVGQNVGIRILRLFGHGAG